MMADASPAASGNQGIALDIISSKTSRRWVSTFFKHGNFLIWPRNWSVAKKHFLKAADMPPWKHALWATSHKQRLERTLLCTKRKEPLIAVQKRIYIYRTARIYSWSGKNRSWLWSGIYNRSSTMHCLFSISLSGGDLALQIVFHQLMVFRVAGPVLCNLFELSPCI